MQSPLDFNKFEKQMLKTINEIDENFIEELSDATRQARAKGLEYLGFGYYGKDGKATHRSVHGQLKLIDKQDSTPTNSKPKKQKSVVLRLKKGAEPPYMFKDMIRDPKEAGDHVYYTLDMDPRGVDTRTVVNVMSKKLRKAGTGDVFIA